MKAAPVSHKEAAVMGWTRVDPRPWSKLDAKWTHPSGWRLEHCGHPTALHPWALYGPPGTCPDNPHGADMVCTGIVGPARRADYGTAWWDLRAPMRYVADLAFRGRTG